MLNNEAEWLARELSALPSDRLDPVLDIGGGAGEFRDGKQPWIAARIFTPLEARGVHVLHHEFAAAQGVEIAGDLDDPSFLEGLRTVGARSVTCFNVLEHLNHRDRLLSAFPHLVPASGYLILSVPRRFPYHADPIDTLYRPSVADLAGALPDFELVSGADVACGSLLRYLKDVPDARTSMIRGATSSLKRIVRRSNDAPTTVTTRDRPATPTGALPYLFRTTSVSCAVFARRS